MRDLEQLDNYFALRHILGCGPNESINDRASSLLRRNDTTRAIRIACHAVLRHAGDGHEKIAYALHAYRKFACFGRRPTS